MHKLKRILKNHAGRRLGRVSVRHQGGREKRQLRLIDFKRNKELSLVKELKALFDKADFVVAHNGKSFDIKWCNSKFAFYKLSPPSPYKIIDTRTEAKKYLCLPSYKLNDIATYFGVGQKLEHEGFSLWEKCIAGNRGAWQKMKEYNKQDVELLAKIYSRLKVFNRKLL